MTRLLCALCGKPLSAVDYIGRESITRGLLVAWHPWCHRKDEGLQLMAWDSLLDEVESRGPGRIGEIEEGP